MQRTVDGQVSWPLESVESLIAVERIFCICCERVGKSIPLGRRIGIGWSAFTRVSGTGEDAVPPLGAVESSPLKIGGNINKVIRKIVGQE